MLRTISEFYWNIYSLKGLQRIFSLACGPLAEMTCCWLLNFINVMLSFVKLHLFNEKWFRDYIY